MQTLKALMAAFPTDADCKRFIQARRWPDGVRCPRCGNGKVYGSKSRPFTWQCKACPDTAKGTPYRFSVLVGTVFENTNYPLKTWFEVLWTMLNSKKGVSALQIQRQIGAGSYKTAWYICHRLRAGMHDDSFRRLVGIVEIDETYIGGKGKNRHRSKQREFRGKHWGGKVGVIGAISRKGNVTAQIIESMDVPTASRFVHDVVADAVTLVATDDLPIYDGVRWGKLRSHRSVNHTAGEYVRGEVHTANLDAFWSLLKRGIIGSYHHVSKKYLPLYINEFTFRHNNRKNADIFGKAIAA